MNLDEIIFYILKIHATFYIQASALCLRVCSTVQEDAGHPG
jgi:hypothetical protein